MKLQIRLLKLWKNGDTEWPEGHLLELDEENAKALVDKGIAEMYEPKAGDIIEVSSVNADSGMTKEAVIELINEIKAKNSNFNANTTGVETQEDLYAKSGGFDSMSHFAYEVFRSTVTKRATEPIQKWEDFLKTKAASGQSIAVSEDGGFAVPTEFRNTLMRNAVEQSIMLNRVRRIPMATNIIHIPTINESSRASSIYGGIIIYRPAEAAAITASKFKMGLVELKLNKLAALAYVTTELLEDSPISMEPLIGSLFSEAIGFQIDEDIINGNGAGQALGMLNAPCLVSVAKEAAQDATTIVLENVIKMWSRLLRRSQRNAIWIANQDTFPQLMTLALPVGTGGSGAGLIGMYTDGVTGTPRMTLLGRPLELTEHCQTLGTVGDIMLVDGQQYLLGEKAGSAIRAATSIHIKFVEDEVAFRFVVRLDGQPWMQQALTPKHSSNTLSSFVATATRA